MNKFRKLGFIEYNGKLETHNSLLNVVLCDKPEIGTKGCEQLVQNTFCLVSNFEQIGFI